MPFVVRYKGDQEQVVAATSRTGPRVFPRGTAVAMPGGEGVGLLRQRDLQFERVFPTDDAYGDAVDVGSLGVPADPG